MAKSPYPAELDGLINLASRNVDVRPTLLRVLTDLYVQKPSHTPDEQRQYVELAHRLIDSADPVTRATVAARLATYPGAPEPILQKLAATSGITVTPPAAAPAKPTEGQSDLAELFFRSSSEDRRLILANFDAGPHRASRPADPATCKLLEAAALTRNSGEFARILQRALAIGPSLAQRIVGDAMGEPLVVAMRAVGMPQAILQRVLLFINPEIGHSVERVYQLASLFDELTVPSAESMIDIWRGGARQRRHQSVYHDDTATSARTAASATHARTTRRSDSLAARFRNSGR